MPANDKTHVKDLEAGNVEHADEVRTRQFFRVERYVAFLHEEVEQAIVDAFRHGTLCPVDLRELSVCEFCRQFRFT